MGWTVVDATVDELLKAVREFLKAEDERASSLNARGTGLTGFVGIILSVAAAAGALGARNPGAGLDHWVRVLVAAAVVAALVVLVAAVFAVLLMVLLPTEGFTIDTGVIEQYPTFAFISRELIEVQGELMNGLVTALRRDRERNASKAKWLRRSYAAVCAGLLLIALAGSAATLDRYVAGKRGNHPARHNSGHGGRNPG